MKILKFIVSLLLVISIPGCSTSNDYTKNHVLPEPIIINKKSIRPPSLIKKNISTTNIDISKIEANTPPKHTYREPILKKRSNLSYRKKLKFVNLDPFSTRISVNYLTKDKRYEVTRGWFELKPGEVLEKYVEYDGKKDESFFVYSESSSPEITKLLTDNNNEKIVLSHYISRPNLPPIKRPVSNSKNSNFFQRIPLGSNSKYHLKNTEEVDFYEVQFDEKTPIKQTINIFPWIFEINNLEEARSRAKQLHKSLQNQLEFVEFLKENAEEKCPISLGFSARNDDDQHWLGVTVDKVLSNQTIFGDPIDLSPGDTIYFVNGEPVFNFRDILFHVFKHARNWKKGGIEEPIVFHKTTPQWKKGDPLIAINSSYFFNPEVYPREFKNPLEASFMAAIESATFGVDRWLFGLTRSSRGRFNKAQQQFIYTQHKARLKQFHPESVFYGHMAGFVQQPTSLIFSKRANKLFRSAGLSPYFSKLATSISLETLESSLFAINTKTKMQSMEDFQKDLMQDLQFGTGIIIIGSAFR